MSGAYMRVDLEKMTVKDRGVKTAFFGTILVDRQLGKITTGTIREELIRSGLLDERRRITIDVKSDTPGEEKVRIPAGADGTVWLTPTTESFGEAWYIDYDSAMPLWLPRNRPAPRTGMDELRALMDPWYWRT